MKMDKDLMSNLRGWRLSLTAFSCVVLMACSSPEEKVQAFTQKGQAYLAEGDWVKARLEFQNALQINPDLVPALFGLAEIAERNSEWQRAFALLGKVVELDPKHLQAQVKLGKLLLAGGQLDKALAVSETATALEPQNAEVLALRAAVLFKLDDRKGAIEVANQALAKDPTQMDALVVLAAERLQAGDPAGAVAFLDKGLAADEKNVALQLIKVQALERMAQLDAVEGIFRKLIGFFPENKSFPQMLAQFYLLHNQPDKAESQYRAIATAFPKDAQAKLEVVRFLGSTKGQPAATAELEKLIAAEPDNHEFKFALAGLYQTQGKTAAAETVFRQVIDSSEDEAAINQARGALATSVLGRGDKPAGVALVKELLEKDTRNEQGLLLRAGLAMEEGRLEDAIGDLRTILRDVPDSARAHAVLARAHDMQGSKDLASDHFARSFAAGRSQPVFGMAYAEFLLRNNEPQKVEEVLREVLRSSPDNVQAMRMLAQTYLATGKLAQAQLIADELAKMDGQAITANQVQGAVFEARRDFNSSVAAFKRAFDLAPTEVQPMVALVRSYVQAGKTQEAQAFLQQVLAASPANVEARLLQGQLLLQTGERAQARKAFETAIGQAPQNPAGYQGLATAYRAENKMPEAAGAIDRGLKAVPTDLGLRLSRAGFLEADGKFEDAIALYEEMLKEQPTSEVLVNNLASLLADHRTDQPSLERAFQLAQRFRNSEIPQFLDTLGWASHKVGKNEDAVRYLKKALDGAPNLAIIQYHVGMTQLALNNKSLAKTALTKAVELGVAQNLPQLAQAQSALKGM